MKASELIYTIQQQIKRNGDLDVEFEHMDTELEQEFSQFNVVHGNNHYRFLTSCKKRNINLLPFDEVISESK